MVKKLIFLPGILALLIFVFLSACDNGGNGGTRLVGIVNITGTPQVGQTLTANILGLGGAGTPSFQWNIVGGGSAGTGQELLLTEVHVGQRLTVTVTRAGYSGSVISTPSDEIAGEGAIVAPWPPTLITTPDRGFNYAGIVFYFGTIPEDATIWYTTGAPPAPNPAVPGSRIEVTGYSFTVPPAAGPPGLIEVRWHGDRGGAIFGSRRTFQIFTPVAIPNHSGTHTVERDSDPYSYEGQSRVITVELEVTDGFIQSAVITSTYNPALDEGKSSDYVERAIAHAEEFLVVMNSAAILVDTMTGATTPHTIAAIRQAADRAIAALP